MTQLMSFVIGFFISIVVISSVQADCCSDVTSALSLDGLPTFTRTFVGFYGSNAAATAACVAGAGSTGTISETYTTVGSCAFWMSSYYTGSNPKNYYYFVHMSDGSCFNLDTDDDGIPDDCDIYPDDPTSYKIKTVSYQTSDNTVNGSKTYQWIHTDRGQTYELGTKDSLKTEILTYTSPWEDPPTTCSGIDKDPENTEPVANDNPFTTDVPTGLPSTTDADPTFQPGEVSDGTETGDALLRDIKTNTGKTATNTDRMGDYMKELTKAAQGIDRNVSKNASGNQDLEYAINSGNKGLKDAINSGNQGLKDAVNSGNEGLKDAVNSGNQGLKDTISSGSGGLKDAINSGNQGLKDAIGSGFKDLKDAIGSGNWALIATAIGSGFQGLKDWFGARDAEDDSEAEGYKSSAESWDPNANYPETIYNGNLKEGPEGDYEKPGDLAEESWLSSFMSSNSLVTALSNSGFQSSGSDCDMTLNLGALGTHHLSLCEFQSEFAAAGNMLLAFCGLTSLIIIVRG